MWILAQPELQEEGMKDIIFLQCWYTWKLTLGAVFCWPAYIWHNLGEWDSLQDEKPVVVSLFTHAKTLPLPWGNAASWFDESEKTKKKKN